MRCRESKLAVGFVVAALSYAATSSLAWAQSAKAEAAPSARIEFDHPSGVEPSVQVDLPAGLWSDVLGLGDAAVAGVAEGLLQAKTHDEGTQAKVKLAADQLAAIHTIVAAIQGAVGEVRVNVYRDIETSQPDSSQVAKYYAKKLSGSEWAQIAQVREGSKTASVFVLRHDGAIRGVFVVANEGHELALVNVLCDISPERVKQITHEATSIGLQVGGDEALSDVLDDLLSDGREAPARTTASLR